MTGHQRSSRRAAVHYWRLNNGVTEVSINIDTGIKQRCGNLLVMLNTAGDKARQIAVTPGKQRVIRQPSHGADGTF
ncbi:hypothetical protein [Erwinia pyrifoliae]|uniref:Uncharacterized protein n=1 Tax=Erwinia pyrifoliae TaxID=79967 RepID=A0ABY5XCH6_ERWPY|nr:hypothetical protein [Erwinia pyrifoliae]UWS31393.1 hypothetical protein NYP81_08145 [Erwinia pyrifoliae]UWS34802.1 hypothetical protein NYP84_06490 [Erwinia pyrifoliae]UXK10967.1 hypothetical protein NYP80_11505 [Erwinia pyrifoliae]